MGVMLSGTMTITVDDFGGLVFQTDVGGEAGCGGTITAGFALFGSFTGTISENCISGTWSAIDGSSGTWSGCQAP